MIADNMTYEEFLESKKPKLRFSGFEVSPSDLNPKLFDWQQVVVAHALNLGKAGLYADCGMGKGPMALVWAQMVQQHQKKRALIVTPLAVTEQMETEGEKFDVGAKYCESQYEADKLPSDFVAVTNYERLKDFKPSKLSGVCADEAGILKAYTGVLKQLIIAMCKNVPYKLAPTATPAPNSTNGDYMEMGNQFEFLDVMTSNEALSRYFINNSMKTGSYRLKRYADGTDEHPGSFWQCLSTFAVCLSSPTDLGYDEGGFKLPELHIHEHVIPVDHTRAYADGRLILDATRSATTMWAEKRATVKERCEKALEVSTLNPGEPHALWCAMNDEVDYLIKLFPQAVVVRGDQDRKTNADNLRAFSRGNAQYIIVNDKMAAFGLNWQHCRHPVFVSPSFSFEKDYQAMRRHWRYGVQGEVHATYIYAESEGNVRSRLKAKREAQARMQRRMIVAMRAMGLGKHPPIVLEDYNPTVDMRLPSWLAA